MLGALLDEAIDEPAGLLGDDVHGHVEVIPDEFSLKSKHEKKSFTVTVSGKGLGGGELVASSQLIWSDGFHFVRSPIVVYAANW